MTCASPAPVVITCFSPPPSSVTVTTLCKLMGSPATSCRYDAVTPSTASTTLVVGCRTTLMTGALLVLPGFGVLVFRPPDFDCSGVSEVYWGCCCSEQASLAGSGTVVIAVWYAAGCWYSDAGWVLLLVVVAVV